jgi:hypothetical protein
MPGTPQINYFNRDFQSLRNDLINWAKQYHPDKLAYFNENNPDILYLEMCAYVGDMLNYYIDKTFNENFRTTAQARESLVRIANDLGFFEIGSTPASTQVILTIKVPAIINPTDGSYQPNSDYLIGIQSGLRARSDSGIYFEILEEINFADERNRKVIPNLDSNGVVIDFTVKKYVTAKAGTTKIQRFYISEDLAKPFLTITLDDIDVTEIIGVIAVPGNQFIAPDDMDFTNPNIAYLEVKYLAQSELFLELNPVQIAQLGTNYIDPIVKQGAMIPISKRFVKRKDATGLTYLTFGSSVISVTAFNQIIQNPLNPINLSFNQILNNTELGEIPPPNSTLFIKYRIGGGKKTDTLTGQISSIVSKTFTLASSSIDFNILQKVRNSLKITNEIPAMGGKDAPSTEEIRAITGKIFAAQDRVVTYEDIKALINNMPAKFGQPYRISCEEIKPNLANFSQLSGGLNIKLDELLTLVTQLDRETKVQEIKDFINSFTTAALNTSSLLSGYSTFWIGEKARLYIISINQDEQLVAPYKNGTTWVFPNELLKWNIKEWLKKKRLMGDWIDIVDGRINNIQIEFTVLVDKNNSQKILIQCLQTLKEYFAINNWQINQPIFIANVQNALQNLNGVINVVEIKFYNIFGIGAESRDPISQRIYAPAETGRYRNNGAAANSSNNKFLMNAIDNIILCWPDTIFEVKYPDNDIIGYVI